MVKIQKIKGKMIFLREIISLKENVDVTIVTIPANDQIVKTLGIEHSMLLDDIEHYNKTSEWVSVGELKGLLKRKDKLIGNQGGGRFYMELIQKYKIPKATELMLTYISGFNEEEERVNVAYFEFKNPINKKIKKIAILLSELRNMDYEIK